MSKKRYEFINPTVANKQSGVEEAATARMAAQDKELEQLKGRWTEHKEGMLAQGSDFTTHDMARLLALTGDIGSVAMTAALGAGNIAAAGVGVGASLADFYADTEDGLDAGDFGSLVVNLGLDLATVIPMAGTGAKFAKIAKAIKPALPLLRKALAIGGAFAGADALATAVNKISQDGYESMSTNDWANFARGLQGVTGAFRGAKANIAKKMATTKVKKTWDADRVLKRKSLETELSNSGIEKEKIAEELSKFDARTAKNKENTISFSKGMFEAKQKFTKSDRTLDEINPDPKTWWEKGKNLAIKDYSRMQRYDPILGKKKLPPREYLNPKDRAKFDTPTFKSVEGPSGPTNRHLWINSRGASANLKGKASRNVIATQQEGFPFKDVRMKTNMDPKQAQDIVLSKKGAMPVTSIDPNYKATHDTYVKEQRDNLKTFVAKAGGNIQYTQSPAKIGRNLQGRRVVKTPAKNEYSAAPSTDTFAPKSMQMIQGGYQKRNYVQELVDKNKAALHKNYNAGTSLANENRARMAAINRQPTVNTPTPTISAPTALTPSIRPKKRRNAATPPVGPGTGTQLELFRKGGKIQKFQEGKKLKDYKNKETKPKGYWVGDTWIPAHKTDPSVLTGMSSQRRSPSQEKLIKRYGLEKDADVAYLKGFSDSDGDTKGERSVVLTNGEVIPLSKYSKRAAQIEAAERGKAWEKTINEGEYENYDPNVKVKNPMATYMDPNVAPNYATDNINNPTAKLIPDENEQISPADAAYKWNEEERAKQKQILDQTTDMGYKITGYTPDGSVPIVTTDDGREVKYTDLVFEENQLQRELEKRNAAENARGARAKITIKKNNEQAATLLKIKNQEIADRNARELANDKRAKQLDTINQIKSNKLNFDNSIDYLKKTATADQLMPKMAKPQISDIVKANDIAQTGLLLAAAHRDKVQLEEPPAPILQKYAVRGLGKDEFDRADRTKGQIMGLEMDTDDPIARREFLQSKAKQTRQVDADLGARQNAAIAQSREVARQIEGQNIAQQNQYRSNLIQQRNQTAMIEAQEAAKAKGTLLQGLGGLSSAMQNRWDTKAKDDKQAQYMLAKDNLNRRLMQIDDEYARLEKYGKNDPNLQYKLSKMRDLKTYYLDQDTILNEGVLRKNPIYKGDKLGSFMSETPDFVQRKEAMTPTLAPSQKKPLTGPLDVKGYSPGDTEGLTLSPSKSGMLKSTYAPKIEPYEDSVEENIAKASLNRRFNDPAFKKYESSYVNQIPSEPVSLSSNKKGFQVKTPTLSSKRINPLDRFRIR